MNESVTEINQRLSLIQMDGSQPFSSDAYLLYAYLKRKPGGIFAELGSGSGVLSLLAVTGHKCDTVYSVEIQEDQAEIERKNILLNRLEENIHVLCKDIRELTQKDFGCVDAVFTNPPYMKCGTGQISPKTSRGISRHELFGGIGDFCGAASRILSYGGFFYAVYRPDRLTDLLTAMREAGIEPKLLTFVCPCAECGPSSVLVKGKKGASPGMQISPNLYLFTDHSHSEETEDHRYIYEHGDFHERFRKDDRKK